MSGNGAERGWLRSRRFDLAWFIAPWWILVAITALRWGPELGFGLAAAFAAFHLIVRLPHILVTGPVTWDAVVKQRSRWKELVAVPVAILAVYVAPDVLLLDPGHRARTLLAAAAIVIGMHHISMQHVGLLSRYRRKAGRGSVSPFDRRMLLAVGAVTVVAALNDLVGSREAAKLSWQLAGWIGAALALLGIAAKAWELRATKAWASSPEFLYYLSAVLTMVPWPFYAELVPAAPVFLTSFFVYNGQHSIAYLGVGWDVASRTPAARPLVYYVRLLGASAVLVALGGGALALVGQGTLSLDFLLGPFVVHYYLDGRLWRRSRATQPAAAPAF